MLTIEERPLAMFGRACGAVANAMDEEGLSKADALRSLFRMMLPSDLPRAVQDAILRLEQTTSDGELWQLLGNESRRVLDAVKNQPAPASWPKSLFDKTA